MIPAMGRHGGKRQRTNSFRRGGWRFQAFPAPGDPPPSAAAVEHVLEAIGQLGDDLPWSGAAERVVPLFQRVRPYPPGYPEPVRRMLPAGVSVTFGVDAGVAFIHVTSEWLERWKTTADAVEEQALANLRRRARELRPRAVVNDTIADLPVGVLQSGSGCASTLVLISDELPRLFGRTRALFIAPTRDLLIALPPDIDRAMAAWIHLEFASMDPNCLAPVGFRLADDRITVVALDEAVAIA
jgi:hypothetical protein